MICHVASLPIQPLQSTSEDAERLRWLVLAANDAADAVLAHDETTLPACLKQWSQHYAASVGLNASHVVTCVHQARDRLAQTAEVLGIVVPADSPAARLMQRLPPDEHTVNEEGLAEPADALDTLGELALAAGVPSHPGRGMTTDVIAVGLLSTGIQDVTQAMVEGAALNDVLRMVLETLFRALGCRRVLLCLRDAVGQHLHGRMGLGQDAADIARRFKLPLQGANDLFAAVCNKGVDTLISDASVPKVAQRLPVWYREQIGAPCFLLLPMQLKGTSLGLIYADAATPGAISMGEQPLALVKTLRSQAVMAFRQAR